VVGVVECTAMVFDCVNKVQILLDFWVWQGS
jgi:hypothetical protein